MYLVNQKIAQGITSAVKLISPSLRVSAATTFFSPYGKLVGDIREGGEQRLSPNDKETPSASKDDESSKKDDSLHRKHT
jgi:hypothetical protein